MFNRDHMTTLPTNFVTAYKTDADAERHRMELAAIERAAAATPPPRTRLVRVLAPNVVATNGRVRVPGELVDIVYTQQIAQLCERGQLELAE